LGKETVSTKRVEEILLILVIMRKPGQSFCGRTISCANIDPAGGDNLLKYGEYLYLQERDKSDL
jgi:hypothetical protein